MVKKLGLVLFCVSLMTVVSPLALGISLWGNRGPESYDAPDNQYHKNGEGFYYVGRMLEGRGGHTATLLKDGRVFMAGGEGKAKSRDFFDTNYLKTTEIFDPKTGTSVPGPSMKAPRHRHRAYLLKDGRVLLYGDASNESNLLVEIYDPSSNTIKEIGELPEEYAISDRDTFIDYVSDHEVMFGKNGLYRLVTIDTQTDSLRYAYNKDGSGETYYIGKINGLYYFRIAPSIVIYKRNPQNKYLLTNVSEIDRGDHISSNWSVLLSDGKRILFVAPDKLGYYDISTEQFMYTPEGTGIPDTNTIPYYPKTVFALNSNSALVFVPIISMIEVVLSGNNIQRIRKPYIQPNRFGTKTELGNGEILYSGGKNSSIFNPYVISDKVYIWKRQKGEL